VDVQETTPSSLKGLIGRDDVHLMAMDQMMHHGGFGVEFDLQLICDTEESAQKISNLIMEAT
jgi:hypothetical protein